VFGAIHGATGGIPRRITQVATRLLLLGAVEQQHALDGAMLDAVMAEIGSDSATDTADSADTAETVEFELVAEEPKQAFEQPVAAPEPEPAPEPAGIDPELLNELLAERDSQIAELQQAVVELAVAQDDKVARAMAPEIAALQERLATIEAQMLEQERTMRHTLTMLIEWVEGEMEHPQAA
jgi:hypothetical protein